jgi:carbonic anhydrase
VKRRVPLFLAFIGMVAGQVAAQGAALADGAVAWDYSAERGPSRWGELSEDFETCSRGLYQSPIDIVDATKAALAPIELRYPGQTVSLLNNGHTLQIDIDAGSSLDLGGISFPLVQLHVHSPSEHRIEGRSFPFEAHFVHQNDRGQLAVLAVLFEEGPPNQGLLKLGSVAPKAVGERVPFVASIDQLGIVPSELDYWRYSGSLTTPPCSEGVLWLVLKARASLSSEQVANFVELIGRDARPLQALNGRLVLE